MNWGRELIAVAIVSVGVAGCDGPRGVVAENSFAAVPSSRSSTDPSVYRLALGDKVKINVFNEPDMSGEFQVNDNGMIALPLAGEVPAVNKTSEELKAAVVRKLSGKYVKNPRVAIEVSSYRPVNVIGEVKNAGQYPYRPGLTVRDAVALAGGYTYRANTHTVYLRHSGGSGEQTIKTDDAPTAVSPGDNIRVPERYF
jgi:polysaccharide export outer membrane protein